MKAYILIDIRIGEVRQAVRQLRQVDGVIDACMTFGPYDAVAVMEADDTKSLGNILATAVQPIPGVQETLTCLCVDE
jgi:DNA-binding Lrp family transcriptional regulator